jgi:hypothetical protein
LQIYISWEARKLCGRLILGIFIHMSYGEVYSFCHGNEVIIQSQRKCADVYTPFERSDQSKSKEGIFISNSWELKEKEIIHSVVQNRSHQRNYVDIYTLRMSIQCQCFHVKQIRSEGEMIYSLCTVQCHITVTGRGGQVLNGSG